LGWQRKREAVARSAVIRNGLLQRRPLPRTEKHLALVLVVPPTVLPEVVGGVGAAAGVGPDLVMPLQEGLLRTTASFRRAERAAVAIALADLPPDVRRHVSRAAGRRTDVH